MNSVVLRGELKSATRGRVIIASRFRSDAVHHSSSSQPSPLTVVILPLLPLIPPFTNISLSLFNASRPPPTQTWHAKNTGHSHQRFSPSRFDNNSFRLMRPAGARQRGQQPQRPGASRNEAFENIFGRPAVGHHLGQAPNAGHAPPVPPGAGYGYSSYPPAEQSNGNAYMNPAQPSLPPGHGFAAPPPRTASYGHAGHAAALGFAPPHPQPVQSAQAGYAHRPYESSSSGHARPAPSVYGGSLSTQVSASHWSKRVKLIPARRPDH